MNPQPQWDGPVWNGPWGDENDDDDEAPLLVIVPFQPIAPAPQIPDSMLGGGTTFCVYCRRKTSSKHHMKTRTKVRKCCFR
jgi:hypothetical protein